MLAVAAAGVPAPKLVVWEVSGSCPACADGAVRCCSGAAGMRACVCACVRE